MNKSLCRGKKTSNPNKCSRVRGCKVITRKGKKMCRKNRTRKNRTRKNRTQKK